MEPAAIPECPKAFYSPLPDSAIHFDFQFQIARDRVYTSDADVSRRGLGIEYLESDAAQIWSRVNEAMSNRSAEHMSELQSLMRTSSALFCLNKINKLLYHYYISVHHVTIYTTIFNYT